MYIKEQTFYFSVRNNKYGENLIVSNPNEYAKSRKLQQPSISFKIQGWK